MGQKHSTLQQEELIYFTKNTPFSSSEIKRLYRRFQQLDRQALGLMLPEDLLSVPELAMNPLSKHLIEFLFKSLIKFSDEIIDSRAVNGMDFESFVDVMSVFHKRTSLEIKFKYLFKLLVRGKSGELTEQNLEVVINELCGPILNENRELILDKTFKLFGANRSQNITEEKFVDALISTTNTIISPSPGFFKMENSIPSSGLVLLVHPLELSSALIRSNIFALKSWTRTIELDTETLLSDTLNSLDISLHQSVYFDMSKLLYTKNFEKSSILKCLRKIEAVFQKKQVPIFASISENLLDNDYLYLISKAIIVSSVDSKTCFEERFSEPNAPFTVSILSKPGSGKLEIDDRFEFRIHEGFLIKTVANKVSDSDNTSSKSNLPISTFNLERKKPEEQKNISEAKIFVEDSDRDSENEMEADADF